MTATTGVKGTPDNAKGCLEALDEALRAAGLAYADVAQIRLNQAAPGHQRPVHGHGQRNHRHRLRHDRP